MPAFDIDPDDTTGPRGADALALDAEAEAGRGRIRRLAGAIDWNRAGLMLGLCLFAIAAYVLYHVLADVSFNDIKAAMSRSSWASIGLACIATAVSYLALIGYDYFALRHIGVQKQVPAAGVALTSFVSHAFTFTLGFAVFTGGAVRWRLYQGFGLKPGEIIAAGALCALTFWLGITAVAGIALTLQPQAIAPLDGLAAPANLAIGLAVAGAIMVWLIVSALKPRSIAVGDWSVPLPGTAATLAAILIGLVDTLGAASALWLLLPAAHAPDFASFLVVFAVGTVLGVVSHVPGGVGVFEATILLGLPGVPEADTVGALLLFRFIYYAAPFALALLLLVGYELRARRETVSRVARGFGALARPLLPRATAIAVFIGGVVLLLSGATPAEHDRMHVLRSLVPFPFVVVETSHFFGSVIGLVLLVVAYGLARRMANAWRLAVTLLLAGAVFSLLKGLDYEEAVVCTAVALVLIAAREEFYRQADLFEVRPSFEWVVAVGVAIASSIWLGFFVSRNVEYQSVLWWDFSYHADTSRFMRATLGVLVAAMGLAAYIVLHRVRTGFEPAGREELDAIAPLAAASGRVEANLALIGDKRFLTSPDGTGFTMYAVQGRSWVAMGDPVAPDEAVDDMIWQFKEVVDRQAGTPVFYQVTTDHLPAYLDAGFSLVKLGEEAWVDLAGFTLEGGEGRRLRQARTKAERSGATFAIIPASEVPAILDELKDVSDAWLDAKGNREKGFSLGFWSPDYVSRYDQAVLRHEGRIVAFANIWRGAQGGEFTVDLMRYRPDGPPGMMDLLFINLLSTAKAQGYAWFNLGMAPLSGLPNHRLASLWSRIGGFLYRRADRFYNFEGLRAYKDKFKPQWRPKYLAFPGGLGLPQVLVDITSLIAASPRRALSEDD